MRTPAESRAALRTAVADMRATWSTAWWNVRAALAMLLVRWAIGLVGDKNKEMRSVFTALADSMLKEVE